MGLKALHRNVMDRVGLMGSLLGGHNWSQGDEREVDARVRHKVGLELIQIDVKRAIEAEGCGDGGHN
jgi:hypothetical protein